MYQQLPPLNALRVFESAARNMSFTRAAKELFVTHGAISKQVKSLEQFLGMPLFIRQHRALSLTEEGLHYLPMIQTALQTINHATQDLLAHPLRAQSITVNVLPSMTINWLIPSLDQFKQANPNLYVDLSIGDFAVDFNQHKYDIAIRSSMTKPTGMQAVKLMDEDLCLVCSPKIASQLTTLDDLNHVTILEHSTRPNLWQTWTEAAGFLLDNNNRIGMEHFYMLSQAAMSNMGIALIPRFFIEEQLANGSLVIPFDQAFISPYTYYLLTPSITPLPLKTQLFIDWIYQLFLPYR